MREAYSTSFQYDRVSVYLKSFENAAIALTETFALSDKSLRALRT